MHVSQKEWSQSVMNGLETSTSDFKRKVASVDRCWMTALESLEISLQAMRDELFNTPEKRDISITGQILIEETAARAAKLVQAAADQHREIQTAIIKIGKQVHFHLDRNIKNPFEGEPPDLETEEDRKNLGLALIYDYVMSNGFEPVGRTMKKLADFGAEYETFEVTQPDVLKQIIMDLRDGEVGSSLEYLTKSESPEERSVIRTLQTQVITESIVLGIDGYDRTMAQMRKFKAQCDEDQETTRRLIGALLLGKEAKWDNRYRNLFNAMSRENLVVTMSSFFVPGVAPLKELMRHGFKGFNVLTRLMNTGFDWNIWLDWELPFDTFPNGKHSAFACPILKEQCCKRNPATRLQCGHVISRDACSRLTANRNRGVPRPARQQRFKCPYCPKEQTMESTREVILKKAHPPTEEEMEEMNFFQFED